ncbi:hypothetical protein AMECASPLE_034964 [Ameca splendens]|uniref:Secreted protein n=1 Tax=Ameca splendens TaxID=208324 RepID=A0ABV0Z709_9TELE
MIVSIFFHIVAQCWSSAPSALHVLDVLLLLHNRYNNFIIYSAYRHHQQKSVNYPFILMPGNGGGSGMSSPCNRWVAGLNPCSVCLSRCVLRQDTSPTLPADDGQMAALPLSVCPKAAVATK